VNNGGDALLREGVQQPRHADEAEHPLQVVRQGRQAELAADLPQALEQEVPLVHPALHRAEGVLAERFALREAPQAAWRQRQSASELTRHLYRHRAARYPAVAELTISSLAPTVDDGFLRNPASMFSSRAKRPKAQATRNWHWCGTAQAGATFGRAVEAELG